MNQPANQLRFVENRDQLGSGVQYFVEGIHQFGSSLLINGWLIDPENQVRSIIIKKPAGKVFSVMQNGWVRFLRPDILQAFPSATKPTDLNGFAFITKEIPEAYDATKMNVIIVLKNNIAYSEFIDVKEINSPEAIVMQAFSVIPEPPIAIQHCEKLYIPAIDEAVSLKKSPRLLFKESFGVTLKKPDLTIIVPVYGGLNLMRFQICNLATYVGNNIEIIFALDDPRLLNDAVAMSTKLHLLFGLNFLLVCPDANLGFAGINNFATEYANSRNLLFLNSDCFPVDPGWDGKVIKAIDDGEFAILGSRLQYMDSTIQHDGISFVTKYELPGFHLNDHPNKSMPSNLIKDDHEKQRPVAVTAAFMAVKKAVFEELGKFDTSYLRGDFEDTDLCLNALKRDMKIGILRNIKIYHLERMSQDHGVDHQLRQKYTLANSARQGLKWRNFIDSQLPVIGKVL